MATVNEIYSVRATAEEGVYSVSCNITDDSGETYDAVHCYRPTDPHGLSPFLRFWFEMNPEFPIETYVPPTAEEMREKMPALTARQLRLGLVSNGISLAQVSATIDAMPAGADKDKAQIEWEYASTFNRMHPLISTVGAALGLTDEQIDTMWAASLSI